MQLGEAGAGQETNGVLGEPQQERHHGPPTLVAALLNGRVRLVECCVVFPLF